MTFSNFNAYYLLYASKLKEAYSILSDITLTNQFVSKHEADIARDHTKELEQQLLKNEKQKFKPQEEVTPERSTKRNLSNKRENDEFEDNKSTISFKTAKTGMTEGTVPDDQHKISKENIIYQKYV